MRLLVRSNLFSSNYYFFVSEEVGLIPKDSVTVYEGQSLYIVFAEIPDNVTGCEIRVPGSSNASSTSELAQRFFLDIGDNCSMTFRNVQNDINGQWNFKIHGDVIFTGKIIISVIRKRPIITLFLMEKTQIQTVK